MIERACACEHLVQDRTERKEIAPIIDDHAFSKLFGRHVVNGSDYGARPCQIVRGVTTHDVGEVSRETEIQQLHKAAAGQENIRGRDVAVHDAVVVRGSEAIDHLTYDAEGLFEWERSAQQPCLQTGALQQFHHDEIASVVFTDVENRADVGMVERRRESGFAFEASNRFGVFGQLVFEYFDGDSARQPSILCLVDNAHTAGAQRANDVEMRDLSSNHSTARTLLSSDSTIQVLERARTGDTSAARILLERALPSVKRWTRGRLPGYARGTADTEDIVQDAFLRTFKNLKRFRHHSVGGLHAYLRQAVVNRIRDLIRASRRHTVDIEAVPEPADFTPSPLERVILRERVDDFLEALTKLRPADRQVVIWRIELGYTSEEIANRLGKSVGAAAMTVSRAMARLAKELPSRPASTD